MEPGRLFTRQDAVASGESDRTLTRLVREGRITRVARGVYRMGVTPVGDPGAIARSMKVALSHMSAAAWYGAALVMPPERLHVTAPRSRGRWSDEVKGVASTAQAFATLSFDASEKRG